jgi:protein-L-isoaspartate(D-aspartate) O-methyltransferase
MDRRHLLRHAALATPALSLATVGPSGAWAAAPKTFPADAVPPAQTAQAFVEWGIQRGGEAAKPLAERHARFVALVRNKDLRDNRNKRAFLMTPREEFVLPRNLSRAYEHAFLDIGWGVTISVPHRVGRMTSVLDVKPGEKALEVGTGSG